MSTDNLIAKLYTSPKTILTIQYIDACISVTESVKDNEILRGLAELLLDEKTKVWVKNHLRKEAIFFLKNYQSVLHERE